MKKIFFALLILLTCNLSRAQWLTSNPNIYYNGGNVGIGTTNPIYGKLDVNGIITSSKLGLGDPSALYDLGTRIAINGSNVNPYAIGLGALDSGKIPMWFQTGTQNGGGFEWYIGTSEKMRIDRFGNVGIGTTSPTEKLSIDGNINLTGNNRRLYMGGYSGSTFGIGYDATYPDYGIFYTEASTDWVSISPNGNARNGVMNIMGNGKVGIGTDAPDNTLHVEGDLLLDVFGNSGHEKGIFFREGFSTTNKYNVSILAYDHNGGGSSPDGLSINGADGVSFSTGSDTRNERMRIAQNGYVGIGTAAPDNTLHVEGDLLLDVFGNSGHEKGIFFREGFSTTNKYNVSILAYDHNGGGSSPDGLSINGADGVSFSTGSDTRNERMRIAQNGYVGIGTAAPTNRLQIGNNPAGWTGNDMVISNGNGGLAIHNDTDNTYLFGDRAISIRPAGNIAIWAKENGNVGIGTTSPTEKLSVDGNILAKKVRVSVAAADWPDYVFASSYELRALSEVEKYIKANQHLPDVPSAKEVETNGLDLGDMDATLLKKVEELTLYLIQENKDKDALKKETLDLQKENQKLNDRLSKIEAILKTLTSK